jgi:hypothetical protein
MKLYLLSLHFDNLDNYMGTDDQALARFSIEAESYSHAVLLANRFCKVFEADRWDLDESPAG